MTMHFPPARLHAVLAWALVAGALPAFADVPITAVPPADYHARAAGKSAPAAFLLAPNAPGATRSSGWT